MLGHECGALSVVATHLNVVKGLAEVELAEDLLAAKVHERVIDVGAGIGDRLRYFVAPRIVRAHSPRAVSILDHENGRRPWPVVPLNEPAFQQRINGLVNDLLMRRRGVVRSRANRPCAIDEWDLVLDALDTANVELALRELVVVATEDLLELVRRLVAATVAHIVDDGADVLDHVLLAFGAKSVAVEVEVVVFIVVVKAFTLIIVIAYLCTLWNRYSNSFQLSFKREDALQSNDIALLIAVLAQELDARPITRYFVDNAASKVPIVSGEETSF